MDTCDILTISFGFVSTLFFSWGGKTAVLQMAFPLQHFINFSMTKWVRNHRVVKNPLMLYMLPKIHLCQRAQDISQALLP